MAADARNLYNGLTQAAAEMGPRLRPDDQWPVTFLIAHGDTTTPLPAPPITGPTELAAVFGGWLPSIAGQFTDPHAAAVMWPGPADVPRGPLVNGGARREAVHVVALDRLVAWQSHAPVNRRAIARLYPILEPFHEPTRIDAPATAASAGHFAHRALLFSLGLVT